MFENIWEGVKSIVVGGVKVAVGVGQAAWALLKFAVKSVLWVVAGIFTIAEHIVQYVSNLISKIFTPKKTYVSTGQNLDVFGKFVDDLQREGKVKVEEEPLIIDLKTKISEAKANNGALVFSEGVDESGASIFAEPRFVKAENGYQENIQEAGNNGELFVKRIRLAN